MKRLFSVLARFRAWLECAEAPAEPRLDPREWADRPPYHPLPD